ncbi:peptidoglycan editing factor PgeF [Paracoccus pacificus]|uniref:Purine nucleoside phosphorylase n=1 Tax=Paracoccus pacificus TaxID=1463598 RepID=A0ABW4RAX6_9RHOB
MQTPLEYLTHPLLDGVRHGFFTRKGGASSGLFASLNCARASGDQAEVVAMNRARVAETMGVGPDRMAAVRQSHTDRVVTVDGNTALDPLAGQAADGLVTNTPGIALTALSADCQPILFADPDAGVIGAAHAGWRGALGGIIESTVAAMQDLGATRIRAVIGPCISQRAYEVGEEFMEEFLLEDPDHSRFFAGGPNGRPMFDLPSFGLMRLRDAGVEAEWTGHCTYSDAARFFSYRRGTHAGQADYGCQIAVIVL